MTKAISPQHWAEMWHELDCASPHLGLGNYAMFVDQKKKEWQGTYPTFSFNNRRYVVHLEEAMKQSIEVPESYFENISFNDIRFDFSCFPLLMQRLGWS